MLLTPDPDSSDQEKFKIASESRGLHVDLILNLVYILKYSYI
jgi:hypothetical protein